MRTSKMKIEVHNINNHTIAELISNEIIIKSIEESADLAGNLYYQNFDTIIVYEKNIVSDFFDLKSGIAGEVLQKFSNFRIRLIIVGDFSKYNRKSLNDFIYECNKGKQINFVASLSEAINKLTIS